MSKDKQHKEQWERCLEIIKCNVKEQEYLTWFRPTQIVNFDDDNHELLLSVPSNYFFEILDGQFKRLIYNAVWRVFGKETRIVYRIQTDSNSKASVDMQGLPTAEKMRKMKDDTMHPMRKTADDDLDPQLNPEYRFENFIEGESNRLPYSIGRSLADNPKQTTFNPFFLAYFTAANCSFGSKEKCSELWSMLVIG